MPFIVGPTSVGACDGSELASGRRRGIVAVDWFGRCRMTCLTELGEETSESRKWERITTIGVELFIYQTDEQLAFSSSSGQLP